MANKHLLGLVLIFVSGLLFGFFAGYVSVSGFGEGGEEWVEQRVSDKNHPLIGQLVDTEPESYTKSAKYKQLEEKIQNYINKELEGGLLSDAAVYIRDLSNGPWIGINFDNGFAPASLLKLPVAIAIYKKADELPEILAKQINASLSADLTKIQHVQPSQHISSGGVATIERLVELMLSNSDNNAYIVLKSELEKIGASTDEVYKDLGVGYGVSEDQDLLISMREYSTFLRVLYNASYLSKKSSNTILSVLSRSEYKRGLVSKLPQNIVVAHKFGERQYNNSEENQQLHDCGIVYKPKRPYIICVMTRGNSQKELEDVIGTISLISYTNL